MNNPTSINTANISQFGFSAKFDLSLKKILLSIANLTIFKTGSIGNITSITFSVTDPTGFVYDTVNINPNNTLVAEISLSGEFMFGYFTIEAVAIESNSKRYPIKISRNICKPEKWDGAKVPGRFDIKADCRMPKAVISETTPLAYLGKQAVSVQRSGSLFYPDNSLNRLDFTTTPFSIGGNDGLYTGLYRVKNTTTATYDLGDQIFVAVPYVTRYEQKVNCDNNINEVLCCIADLYSEYNANRGTTRSVTAKSKIDMISPDIIMLLMNDQSGKDCTRQIERIKELIGCDCGCGETTYLPPSYINGAGDINITGAGGTTVSFTQTGSTKSYTVTSRTVNVGPANPNDPALTVTQNITGTSSTFLIGIDYTKLSKLVLDTIAGNQEFLALLNQIINSSEQGLTDGLDGKCVINLASADYSLLEPGSALKTINQVVIDGTVYPAPANLSMTQTVAIKNWLDGLSKGTFNISYDNATQKLSITSSSNTHSVSTMTFVLDSVSVTREFSKITAPLVDILQAIIDAICSMDTTDIKLSEELVLCKRNSSGVVTNQSFAQGSALQLYLAALNAQMCVYASSAVKGDKGDTGAAGRSVQVFVQPGQPTGGTYFNGDMWIVQ